LKGQHDLVNLNGGILLPAHVEGVLVHVQLSQLRQVDAYITGQGLQAVVL